MALPFLIKQMYNGASDEVVKRGKKIFSSGSIDLLEIDELTSNITFRVKDDSYNIYYKVYINHFRSEKQFTIKCSCPYNLSEVCKHKAASLLQLQDLIDKNQIGQQGANYKQSHTVVKMKTLDLKSIRLFTSFDSAENAQEFLRSHKAKILEAKEETVIAEVFYQSQNYTVVIKKNEERNFDTSCGCQTESSHPLCVHKTIIFLQLFQQHGANYFDSIRNWDKVKNKLLSIYGYSLNDDLTGKFEFIYKEGKPFLRVLDTSIKRVETPLPEQPTPSTDSYKFPIAPAVKKEKDALPTAIAQSTQAQENNIVGVALYFDKKIFPYVQFNLYKGLPNEFNNGFEKAVEWLDLNKYVETNSFCENDKLLVQQVRKLLSTEVTKYIDKNSPFAGIWDNVVQLSSNQQSGELPQETKNLMVEYLYPKLQKLFTEKAEDPFVFSTAKPTVNLAKNLKHFTFSNTTIVPYFLVNIKGKSIEIECRIKLPLYDVSLKENEQKTPLFFVYNDTAYLWESAELIQTIEPFVAQGKMVIDKQDWQNKLLTYVMPLSKQFDVEFGNLKKEEIKNVEPVAKVQLTERGDYLVFETIFSYNNYTIKDTDKEKIVFPYEDKLLVVHRNIDLERQAVDKIQVLHSNFVTLNNPFTLALKGNDVLRNNWFFLFIDAMKDAGIMVFGFDALKNYRFNTAKPTTRIHISSNTDWFDAKVEIDFNGQKVTVADVKKALANKQQFVPLSDGSLGILPEDWVRKYSLLFKVGEGKQGNLKISKFQYSVIEELYNERDEEELFIQLEEKYDKLRYNYEIKKIDTPTSLNAVLRPYQESGFQWLNYLKEVQWGGILADDMGLGKTIQALSFLQHLKSENTSLKALVVCPTTLLFNWQNEIEKFTPELEFLIHHGGARLKAELREHPAHIIITTYGTLRSDIKEFVEVDFDYVVLDESQAIKNPTSKVTKAACLLRAKNRLCLSGTPLQNNTFDIFAQMNFLNPGMLGSQEFFKSEFAVPIDKFGEKEQKDHLRKLLYPFILRRTKEQVAKDLPEKQETILFCEMGSEQRKIYDAYRNDFRDKIMGVVQEVGIQKSQLTILQGLMKLRQICDSPAILKEVDGEAYPNHSVKIEELGREITENISNHKALIFSQFLGMLALIKQKLEELGVPYEYFDGSTSSKDREKAINNFQSNNECRVFLISLKAGGVGLNLTAADYVYLVDPWWNPAVEQQAIDRTHRIGQTKNIFAYRMICSDSVEDKIIKLQERKKSLAKDLITDDEGFVKSLTKEDVEYLFS